MLNCKWPNDLIIPFIKCPKISGQLTLTPLVFNFCLLIAFWKISIRITLSLFSLDFISRSAI